MDANLHVGWVFLALQQITVILLQSNIHEPETKKKQSWKSSFQLPHSSEEKKKLNNVSDEKKESGCGGVRGGIRGSVVVLQE